MYDADPNVPELPLSYLNRRAEGMVERHLNLQMVKHAVQSQQRDLPIDQPLLVRPQPNAKRRQRV
jgi:hypothetical protein